MPIPVLAARKTSGRTIYELERAGLAGCHLEDQEFPKRCGHLAGKSTDRLEDMEEKIKAAVAARRDQDFLIMARTDARAVEDFDEAVTRAQRYVAAGADAIFPEALQTRGRIQDFRPGSDGAAAGEHDGVWESPLLSFKELDELGYRMVIFPHERVSGGHESDGEFLRDVEKGGNAGGWLDKMQTRKELYELLDYDPAAESWPGYTWRETFHAE